MFDRRWAALLAGTLLIAGCTGTPTAPIPMAMELWITPRDAPKNAAAPGGVRLSDGARRIDPSAQLSRTSRSAAR